MPSVSVIIPTYNRARYVSLAIDSVLAQTYADRELIVVDDGSQDETAQILTKYGDRIRYIFQENQGESAARQRGLEFASGDYLAFLDSDDVWEPAKLQKQMAIFAEHPTVGWVYSHARMIDVDGKALALPPLGYGQTPDGLTLGQFILGNFVVGPGSTLVVRRECLERVGTFAREIRFGEDWDFCLRLAAAYPFACVLEPLVQIRLHQRGWLQSVEHLDRLLADHLLIVSRFFSQRPALPPDLARLEPLAEANRRAFAAFEYYAYGYVEKGREELHKACKLAPTVWANAEHFLRTFAEHTMLLVDVGTEARALELAQTVAHHPPEPLSRIGLSKSRILGSAHMTLAYRCQQHGNLGGVRSHVFRAVQHDPRWLRNRGALSMAVRSLLRPRSGRPIWDLPEVTWPNPWIVDATLQTRSSQA